MQLHEIIESDGLKRLIIDFDSDGRPVTKPYDGEPSLEEPTEKTSTEESEAVDTESTELQIAEFKCQYCGQICKSNAGLITHEKHCKENPANK